MSDARQAWEERYGERDRIWSGRVNVRLAEMADALTPGRALDIGCGEGADALWLAERGWQVVAVDLSQTALARAAEDARSRGLADRIVFEQHDLSQGFPGGTFDLVSAQFFHSEQMPEREPSLRRAAVAVAPGGLLLIVDHAAPPPWATEHLHSHPFPSAEEVVASLDLDPDGWDRVRVGPVERSAVGPDGQAGLLTDNVIALRRR